MKSMALDSSKKNNACHASQTSVSMVTPIESFRFEDKGDLKGNYEYEIFSIL